MNERFFSLVLHSHIPYVLDHGSWPHGMDWIYEAAAETYIPVLRAFDSLADEGVAAAANISFTPVVAAQLKDPGFVRGFDEYLRMKVEIARADRAWFERTGNPSLPLTAFWEEWYDGLLRDFHGRFEEDIIASFRKLEDRGAVEILTSAATHGYLPLLGRDESVRHQILQGRHTHRQLFGREPRGFWIPECAYRPGYDWTPPFGGAEARTRRGVDEILDGAGLGYFFVDAHLLRGGETLGVYAERFPGLKTLWETSRKESPAPTGSGADPYTAHMAYPSRLPFFARDEATGSQVWSRQMGYPGDGAYLEFHKKHYPGGLRYWRITGPGSDLAVKDRYDPAAAEARVEAHAAHFAASLESALASRESGVVTALYDTELFGHWWFEGPRWLYAVMKKLAAGTVRPVTASTCLERLPPRSVVALPEGSWGQGGFHWVWLNEDTGWVWKRIYEIEDEARAIEAMPGPANPRLLRQFYREKFLLESSDWPFLISTGTARDYAEGRAAEHFSRASEIARWLRSGRTLGPAEETTLRLYETEDGLFEEMVDNHGTPIQ
jgi:1,4-alpha-glucan branching enzyme